MCKLLFFGCAAFVVIFACALFRNAPPSRRPAPLDEAACQNKDSPSGRETHVRAGAQFDIIVFGASGFAGSLVSLYLATAPGDFKFAIAGRSFNDLHDLDKLIADTVRYLGHGREADAMFLAEADEVEDMKKIARKAKVIVSAIDPYTKYGSTLVQVCAEEGTHYADLSREFAWQRRMIDGFHRRSKTSGAKIVFAAGFHALPFDLGAAVALQALDQAVSKSGTGTSKAAKNVTIMASVTSMRGAGFGGVSRALQSFLDQPENKSPDNDPYLLVPNASCPVDSSVTGWGRPRYDSSLKIAGFPHVMGLANSRIVRRSLELLGRRSVTYGESMSLGGVVDAFVFGRWKARPSLGAQASGGYTVKFAAVDEDARRTVHVSMEGRGDPEFAHASKLLAEVGLCLADRRCHRKGMGGGVFTPISAMDTSALLARLRAAKHEDGLPLLTLDIGRDGSGTSGEEL